jgi:hypothetical protein
LAAIGEPQRAIKGIAIQEFERILAHENPELVLGVCEQTIGSINLKPSLDCNVFHSCTSPWTNRACT